MERAMSEPILNKSTAVTHKIAVVVPSYKVRAHILDVIAGIGPECQLVYVIDDHCPEGSGEYVERNCRDSRVHVLRNARNLGVGGAVLAGYRQAIADGADIIVKIDGDGQMDPSLLPTFVAPILAGSADYTKGNRFFDLTSLSTMPKLRIFGNAALSFMAKLSTGYWNLFDPTNGYTAIHARVAEHIPFDKISTRYFFESDLLFRLNTLRAVVVDIPMDARYADEVSNLHIRRIVGEFFLKNIRNTFKRVFYNYFLRDFSVASLELIFGLPMLIFGVAFGISSWSAFSHSGIAAPSGTVMLAALPVLLGFQLLLAFLSYDISAIPRTVLHRLLPKRGSSLNTD